MAKKQKFKKTREDFLNILNNFQGQALHAQTLEFDHPTKNKWLSFEQNPMTFKKMLNLLKNLSS